MERSTDYADYTEQAESSGQEAVGSGQLKELRIAKFELRNEGSGGRKLTSEAKL